MAAALIRLPGILLRAKAPSPFMILSFVPLWNLAKEVVLSGRRYRAARRIQTVARRNVALRRIRGTVGSYGHSMTSEDFYRRISVF